MTKIILTIEGGMLINVQSTEDVECILVDEDVKESTIFNVDLIISDEDFEKVKKDFSEINKDYKTLGI